MKHLFCCLSLSILFCISHAQISYPISSFSSTPRVFKNLLLTNEQIEANDTINEEILDLVSPMVQDSVLGKKEPHHRLFLVGWMIHTFAGYGWRAVDPIKEKYVGTIRGEGRSGTDHFTEYDINFDLYCHLHDYLFRSFRSFDKQASIKRQDIRAKIMHRHHKPTDYTVPPFVRDTNNVDMYQYRMHCELTPPKKFRPMLHELFYPVLPGTNIPEHPNFMDRFPSMGFYGASCLDCNHNCHPEIHPYEWIWWMNLHNGSDKDKTWLLGLMKESSNRFPGWSSNPKTGKVCVPFSFEIKDTIWQARSISVDHLVFNRFIDSNLQKLNLPPTTFDPNHRSLKVVFTDGKGLSIPISVLFVRPIVTDGLKYWFSEVNWDEPSHILSGWINFATSVEDVYTVKLTMSGQ